MDHAHSPLAFPEDDPLTFGGVAIDEALGGTPEPGRAEPLVSLIFVSYNNGADMPRLLESVRALEYGNVEVLLVDNGSSDGGAQLMVDGLDDVLMVPRPAGGNPGYGAACNAGARHATGEYLVFLNCDIVMEPASIDELVRPLGFWNDIGAVMAKLVVREDPSLLNASAGDSHFLGFSWNRGCLQPDANPDADDVADVGFACGAAMAVRRDAFVTVGGFDESFFMYLEDTDLSWRLKLAGYRVVVSEAARVHHDYSFFATDRRFCYWAERNRLRMLLKTYRWRSLLLLAPMFVAVELVVVAYAIRERWLLQKVRAWGDTVRHLPDILRARRRTQLTRVSSGRSWTAEMTGGMASPHLRHPLVRVGNPVLQAWWRLVRGLVR